MFRHIRCQLVLVAASALIAATGLESRAAAASAPPTIPEVDRLWEQWDTPDSPGGAIAIVKDGDVLGVAAYGLANIEHQIPFTTNTVFPIASVSKHFTALAVAKLAAEGRLSLDDDVRTYVPELHDHGTPITLRHLIAHTSGLRSPAELLFAAGLKEGDDFTEHRLKNVIFSDTDLSFPTGERSLYSNSNYMLLAIVVEQVTGQPFEEWIAEAFFEPAGMTETRIVRDGYAVIPNLAQSYAQDGNGVFIRSPVTQSAMGSTNVYSTIEDMAKWVGGFSDGPLADSGLMRIFEEPGRLNDGSEVNQRFGVVRLDRNGLGFYRGSGNVGGYLTALSYFPEQRFGIVAFANAYPTEPLLDPFTISDQVADILLADDMTFADEADKFDGADAVREEVVELSPAERTHVSGTYWSSNFIRRIYDNDGVVTYWRGPESETPMAPVNRHAYTFVGSSSPVSVRFEPEGAPRSERMIVQVDAGEPTVFERIESEQGSDPASLREFEGYYANVDFGGLLTIEVQEDRLVAKSVGYEPMALTPTKPDYFRPGPPWWLGHTVRFERAADGSIAGLRVDNYQSENIGFRRMRLE